MTTCLSYSVKAFELVRAANTDVYVEREQYATNEQVGLHQLHSSS
jgi:hypothetical protein